MSSTIDRTTPGDGCGEEERVVAAIASGARGPGVDAHLEDCSSCRDAALAAEFLAVAGRRTVEAATPPPAALVWRRAADEGRIAKIRRAARLVRLAQGVAIVGAAAISPLVAAVSWGSIGAAAVDMVAGIRPVTAQGLDGAGLLFALVAGAATLMIYGLHSRWVEA